MLNRKQRLLIFKLSALLSLVRWYNIFFLALSQYLAVIFILNDPANWINTLLNIDLHLIVFASLFCVAGGYIINNFYDLEKDLINRPNKTLYEKIVKQSTALRLYFLFNVIGALLGFLVSFNVFLFFSAFIFFMWLYSHKLKKITFIGNMVAALLAITPFFAIFIYYHLEDLLIITYISFILLVIFIREIIKDLEALKGDVIIGYHTLPATIGIYRTKWIIVAFALSGFIPATAIFIKTGFSGVSYYMAAGLAGLLISIAFLLMAQKKKHYVMLNNMYRLLIIGGILSLMLFT
ncbi:MAG TPA: ubiquinone biosynthesis protein UbiA [Cryomorphaceae bacterium]|nr:ubiquinone biosynthesis protein UbiA [Owenweeksia sp.]MBG00132.1 ubiquinone biosynthesis protein UbiA [Owenweeksia sp.]HAD96154.1 ubiquinone biosynthesis protein UbiA [Cryomorphaceae bacterium]HBF20304.1 ubiquinone biosynthesis protein UbiA [Cryomorphaceae bacterium]|tara:strand:- start:68 stop:946 length:879 start_codon:yes stop_codon:yes gene_type:complete